MMAMRREREGPAPRSCVLFGAPINVHKTCTEQRSVHAPIGACTSAWYVPSTDRTGTVRMMDMRHKTNTKRVACRIQAVCDMDNPDLRYPDRPWLSTPAHVEEWTRTLTTWRLLPHTTVGDGDCLLHCALNHVRFVRRYWRSIMSGSCAKHAPNMCNVHKTCTEHAPVDLLPKET